MKRSTLFNIHFYLSSFFTPFLFLMAITGTFYLNGYKGSVESKLVMEGIQFQTGVDKKEQVAKILNGVDSSYSFEYLKDRGSSIQTRPTTRDYYNFKKSDDGTFKLYKDSPNFLLRIIEVHKGHGPKLLKYLEMFLGVSLFFIVLSGLLMSLQMKARVKQFVITSGIGAAVLLVLFLL
jgi:uncharacterized iron-regulated membrane protein